MTPVAGRVQISVEENLVKCRVSGRALCDQLAINLTPAAGEICERRQNRSVKSNVAYRQRLRCVEIEYHVIGADPVQYDRSAVK